MIGLYFLKSFSCKKEKILNVIFRGTNRSIVLTSLLLKEKHGENIRMWEILSLRQTQWHRNKKPIEIEKQCLRLNLNLNRIKEWKKTKWPLHRCLRIRQLYIMFFNHYSYHIRWNILYQICCILSWLSNLIHDTFRTT